MLTGCLVTISITMCIRYMVQLTGILTLKQEKNIVSSQIPEHRIVKFLNMKGYLLSYVLIKTFQSSIYCSAVPIAVLAISMSPKCPPDTCSTTTGLLSLQHPNLKLFTRTFHFITVFLIAKTDVCQLLSTCQINKDCSSSNSSRISLKSS